MQTPSNSMLRSNLTSGQALFEALQEYRVAERSSNGRNDFLWAASCGNITSRSADYALCKTQPRSPPRRGWALLAVLKTIAIRLQSPACVHPDRNSYKCATFSKP